MLSLPSAHAYDADLCLQSNVSPDSLLLIWLCLRLQAKSSEMNVSLPILEDGQFAEMAIPEQCGNFDIILDHF